MLTTITVFPAAGPWTEQTKKKKGHDRPKRSSVEHQKRGHGQILVNASGKQPRRVHNIPNKQNSSPAWLLRCLAFLCLTAREGNK